MTQLHFSQKIYDRRKSTYRCLKSHELSKGNKYRNILWGKCKYIVWMSADSPQAIKSWNFIVFTLFWLSTYTLTNRPINKLKPILYTFCTLFSCVWFSAKLSNRRYNKILSLNLTKWRQDLLYPMLHAIDIFLVSRFACKGSDMTD